MSNQNNPTSMGSFEQDFFRRDVEPVGSTAEQGTMKKRLMRKYENGLATKSLDDAPLREMPSVAGFSGGLGCASMDRRGDDEMSTKKQRGHRRTMDYLQNFSIQVLSSLGQFGRETTLESPPTQLGTRGFSSSSSDAHTDTECGSHTVHNNLAAIAEAASMAHPYQKAPFMPNSRTAASNHSKSTSLYSSSSAYPSSQSGYNFRSNAFQSVQHGHRVPPEGTTLPPKAKVQKPVQKSLKNTWPASMLSNVVSLAQMFMIANQPPSANPVSDNDGDSIGTGSVSSSQRGHHYQHGNGGMMGVGMNQELPLDSLSSRSFSTDSHDSRFVKLWSENMHLDTPGGGGDVPATDAGYGGGGGGIGGRGSLLNRDVMVFGHGNGGGGIGANTGHSILTGLSTRQGLSGHDGFPTTLTGGGKTVIRKTIIGQPTQLAHDRTNMGPPQRDIDPFTTKSSIYPPPASFTTSSSSSISPNGVAQDTSIDASPLASSSSVWRDCPTPMGTKTISSMLDHNTQSKDMQDASQGLGQEQGQEDEVAGEDSKEKGNEKRSQKEGTESLSKEGEEGHHTLKGNGTTQS